VERAEAELERVRAGAPAAEVSLTEQQVTTTQLALQRAEADLARLQRGADPAEVRTAERDVATTQTAADRAQADLDRLTRGPDPFDVRAAERDVERAQSALRAAESLAAADANARAARDAAMASARIDIVAAQDRLARLREPAKPADVEIARRNLEVARREADAARARLESTRKGPDQLSLDTATAAVDNARLAYERARTRQLELQAGPTGDQVAAAMNAVEAARTALAAATSRQADLANRPTPAELRDAGDRVTVARAALDRARAEAQLAQPADADSSEILLLQRTLEQDRAQVASLERDLAATRLPAPFAGTIVAVYVRPGDPLEPGRPVLLLAKQGEATVRAAVGEREAPRLAAGQAASVQITGGDGPFEATVSAIGAGDGGVGRVAYVSVQWPAAPAVGTHVDVQVTLQQKDGALIVPKKAVRSTGSRHYVQFVQGTSRRVASVEIGIVSATEVEILKGLVEGQVVVAGP
jgi:multidrug resistance efflux pump